MIQGLRRFQALVQFIQRALNSVNATFKVQSELELCAEIVQAAKNGGGTCTELGKALCMDSRIMPFAHIIGEYCQKFAGGSDGPMIRFLHAFSLEFGKGIQLGHEFWECIAKCNFGEEGLFVFTRSWSTCMQLRILRHNKTCIKSRKTMSIHSIYSTCCFFTMVHVACSLF